jgi:antitoxin VapB
MSSTARLFQNGQSQAVRLPREFRFDGDRVHVRRVGQAVVLFPWRAPWQTLVDSLPLFSSDFAAEGLTDAPHVALPVSSAAQEQPGRDG